jgi:alkylation response protein AidB-like acyl-CoA dehydrogenase
MKRALFEDEHDWFRESVAAFVDRELMPSRERFREQRSIDREVWLKAGADGFLGLGVPSEYGGSGTEDFRFNAIFGEELARAGFAYASSFGIQTDVVAPYLLRLTSEEQRTRWLPGFCRGEIITAIGMSEPAAGSDLKGIQSTARRDGDGWSLSGSKTFITNGLNADLVVTAAVVLAQTLEYVMERRAFGRPVGSFQNSRFVLAEADAELDMARVYVDRCVEAHVAGELTAVEAAKAKLVSSEIQNRVIDACLQLHGGYGYIEEYEVARSFVDARITRIWAGTNEIMKEVIGRSLGLEEPRG